MIETRIAIADALLDAPAWARVGLAVRDDRLREQAADALAARITATLNGECPPHPDQLRLAL